MNEFELIFQFLISSNCQGEREPEQMKNRPFFVPKQFLPSIVSTWFIDYGWFRNSHFFVLAKPTVRSPFSHDLPDMGGKSGSLARRFFRVCMSSVLSSGYLVCSIRKYSSYGVATVYAIWCPDRGFSGRVRNTHTKHTRRNVGVVGRRIGLCRWGVFEG